MSSEDKYARAVAKVVAAQIMTTEGLDSAQRSTIDILSDLLVRYIAEVGSQSHMYAELSHRTECSPADVATALKNMGQTIPSLLQYAKKLDEDSSLVQNVSNFPLSKGLPLPPSFTSTGETPPSHIPAFLPAFPDPHTLMETAKFIQTAHTTQTRQKQLTEQQEKGEEALLRMEAREHPDSAPLRSAKERLEDGKPSENDTSNAFLAPVLWETDGAEEPGVWTKPGAAAGPAVGAEEMDAEWKEPEENGKNVPDLNIEAFQMNATGTRVALATSGRAIPDAYGDEPLAADPYGGAGLRRRTVVSVTDATRNRAREILANREEEAEMGIGTEETPMDLENI